MDTIKKQTLTIYQDFWKQFDNYYITGSKIFNYKKKLEIDKVNEKDILENTNKSENREKSEDNDNNLKKSKINDELFILYYFLIEMTDKIYYDKCNNW